ncbi:hypothetical protein LX64_05024 [Chitinophaga skermanii]|uniref:CHAT domain-containing protein n=1 Tax=Chitinophaga skermanii TaxID=331697 RepID=A0A327PZS9_9BACT|nr:hypothetical protein [Chitinophaga skermanii]RAI97720.1 hypothetical protein LX64_05024 [Chitinophaga skermanii]
MDGHIGHIVVIESLENEKLTGKEIYDDCISRQIEFRKSNLTHKYYSVNSKDQLFELLKLYIHTAEFYESGLLLHFEMHGADNQEGIILSNGELVKWTQLVEQLREINIKTKNRLYVSMATCFGRYMYLGVDPYKKAPYAAFISASVEVNGPEIVENFTILFENLIKSGNLIDSYLIMENYVSKFYYKDSKTVFEASFESIMNQLYGDEQLKAQILSEANKEVLLKTGVLLTDQEAEYVFKKALADMFERQYDAFKFNN